MKVFSTSILRTPLLNFEVLENITNAEQLITLFQQPLMREAIYLASPALHDELLKNKPDDKIIQTLTKYLQRAATRCTPFALFATCGTANIFTQKTIDDKFNTDVEFKQRRHTRLDMNYLCALAQQLSNHPKIKPHLIYYPNSSIYSIKNKIRYTEYVFIGTSRKHQLSMVDKNEYLDHILQESSKGATIYQLIEKVDWEDISIEEAENYINEIIQAQLLVSNLEPSVTGPDFLDQIILVLEKIENDEVRAIVSLLNHTKQAIVNIDHSPMGIDSEVYRTIGNKLKILGVEFDWKYLFQTDSYREVNLGINSRISDQVWDAIKMLGKLSINTENSNLKKFKEAFYERYEDKEVSFIEVLDNENGLGYPYVDNNQNDLSPLVDDIYVGFKKTSVMDIKWHPVHNMLFKKIIVALKKNEHSIEINAKDVEHFDFDEKNLPDTIASLVSITEYDRGNNLNTIFISHAGGSSAMNLLGRFCHGDAKINQLTAEIVQKENELNPDIIFAEIVHLPEARIGNIASRPVLRKHEIVYLAKNGCEDNCKINLSDLLISLKDNKLVLRSKKFNKIVIPRLGNAHNFSFNSLPIYHFLCDLQNHYNQSSVGIDLSFFKSQLSFIPRITYKNCVFSPAIWQFKKNELEYLQKVNDEELLAEIQKMRIKYHLPEHMLLPDGDNELYVNWNNLLSVKCLLGIIKNREDILLSEFQFNYNKPFIRTVNGSYTNQLIFCFHKENKPHLNKLKPVDLNVPPNVVKRHFVPGSRWLYFKIYTGAKTSDEILSGVLFKLTLGLKKQKLIDKFFFIRYADPKQHFRYRILVNEQSNITDILKTVHDHLEIYLTDNLISKVQLDTYNRELERYGENSIELTESLFDIDSELCLNIISHLEGDEGDTIRWKIGLLIVDTYLNVFGLTIEEKMQFTSGNKLNFELEFNLEKPHKEKISKKFRESRTEVNYILDGVYEDTDECMILYKLVNEYTIRYNKIAVELFKINPHEKVISYLSSYIHMSINRFFRSKQRLHELMIYTYLNKYYESKSARIKKEKNSESFSFIQKELNQ